MMASNDPVDHGHRWAAKRRPIVADRELTTAGGKLGARVKAECLLDALHAQGWLRAPGEDEVPAKTRLRAGLWMRECFSKAGLTPVAAAAYEVSGSRQWPPPIPFGEVGEDGKERTDAETWNLRCYRDTLMDLKRYSRLLQAVCCHDERVRDTPLTRVTLRDGLDRLAHLRGIE